MRRIAAALVLALAAAAAGAEDASEAIRAAVANPGRPDEDRARDAARRPDRVLAFFGIRPGMRVLDLNSGGGYYSEILSHLVGPQGRVIAHNDEIYHPFVEAEVARRYAGGRLPNLETLHARNDELALAEASLDAVLLVLAFHDYWYVPEGMASRSVDVDDLLRRLHRALVPGGVLGVVDHAAPPGTPLSAGGSLHRIDPAAARRMIEAAGFAFEAESDALRNPRDDLKMDVFDERVRGRTDRFVYRFRKPPREAPSTP